MEYLRWLSRMVKPNAFFHLVSNDIHLRLCTRPQPVSRPYNALNSRYADDRIKRSNRQINLDEQILFINWRTQRRPRTAPMLNYWRIGSKSRSFKCNGNHPFFVRPRIHGIPTQSKHNDLLKKRRALGYAAP